MPPSPQAERRVEAAGAVVFDTRGRVLLVRRGHAPARGEWTLPGGRLEADETPEAAVVRELHEETALRGRVVAALGVVTLAAPAAPADAEGIVYVIHEFLVATADAAARDDQTSDGAARAGDDAAAGGAARAGDDAAAVCWASPEDLIALGVRANAVAVIEQGRARAVAEGMIAPGAPGARRGA